MGRAISITELNNRNPETIELTGAFAEGIGERIEKGCRIFIYGKPRNGKSTFVAQLTKELASKVRTAYNSLEEGLSLTLTNNFKRVHMNDVNKKVVVLNKMPYAELCEFLAKRQSPGVVVIDSVQYFKIKFADWLEMEQRFPKVIWVIVSQVKGKEPKGQLADDLYYHADVKIWVEGFKAFPASRFGGGEDIVVWDKGASEYGHSLKDKKIEL